MIQLHESREVFRAFGFPVSVHPSWLAIFLLLTWSLATGWFPLRQGDLSVGSYYAMGAVGALALFGCIVLHELAHALVARHRGMHISGITLFLFGGVAQLGEEPPTPATEFQVAIAGPVASALIALAAWGLAALGRAAAWPDPAVGVLDYVAAVNFVLVAFNAVPAFPLDGGRVLRSALWRLRGDLRWATRVASTVGGGFGALLVALGILSAFTGSVLGGVWFALIGLFVRGAALGGYRQLVLRQVLEGEPAARFADKSITPVSPWLSIQELVEGHVYRGRAHAYPVAENGRLLGMITTSDLRSVPRDRWHHMRVRDLMVAPSSENSITPDVDAMTAFRKMTSSGRPRLMVTDRDGRVGILTLKDLLEVAEIMLEMEGAQ
jgi:Zn-dependent protease/CBS domain-containing protein